MARAAIENSDNDERGTMSTITETKGLNCNLKFAVYGSLRPVPLWRLLCEQNESGMLVARAEESGCEACYVEVARWVPERERFEKYAFLKLFGGEEIGEDYAGLNDADACRVVAEAINECDDWVDVGLAPLCSRFQKDTDPTRHEVSRTAKRTLEILDRIDAADRMTPLEQRLLKRDRAQLRTDLLKLRDYTIDREEDSA